MLQRLHTHQRRLRMQRNTLLPVSRLPPEVLLLVFEFCVSGGISVFHPSRRIVSAYDTRFSQVCTAWRALAFGAPELWRAPPLQHPDLAALYLQRAHGSPLSIVYDGRAGSSREDALLATLTDMSQLQHIVLRHLELLSRSNRFAALQQPAPQLETLFLHTSLPMNFGGTFLSCTAPRLRALALRGCTVSWDVPIFAQLTRLDLTGWRGGQTSWSWDIDTVLMTLLHTPLLESFTLTEALALDASGVEVRALPGGRVALAQLQRIRIVEEELLCSLILLAYLQLPMSSHLFLRSSSDHAISKQTWPELLAFMRDLPSIKGPPFLQALRLAADDDLVYISDDTSDGTADRRFVFEVYPQDPWFPWIFELVLQEIPVANLTRLTIGRRTADMETSDAPSAEQWLYAFTALPRLAHITLEHDAAFEFVLALYEAPLAPAMLRTISFFRADLTAMAVDHRAKVQELLLDALRRRERSGETERLERLKFEDCHLHLTSDVRASFQKWVDEVGVTMEVS
jgi:hypothetical protein